MKVSEVLRNLNECINKTVIIDAILLHNYLIVDNIGDSTKPNNCIYIDQKKLVENYLSEKSARNPVPVLSFLPWEGFPRSTLSNSYIKIEGVIVESSSSANLLEIVNANFIHIYKRNVYHDKNNNPYTGKQLYVYIQKGGIHIKDLPVMLHNEIYSLSDLGRVNDNVLSDPLILACQIIEKDGKVTLLDKSNVSYVQQFSNEDFPIMYAQGIFGMPTSNPKYSSLIFGHANRNSDGSVKFERIDAIIVEKVRSSTSYIWACYEDNFDPKILFT